MAGTSIFSLSVFVVLIFWAALSDLVSFKIPNAIPIAISLLFLPTALLLGWDLSVILTHIVAGAGVLLLGFLLFMRGYIGGGDAKLLAAASIWTGFEALYAFFLFVSIAGGILAILLLGFRWFNLPKHLQRIAWLERLHGEKKHIPYGVAISSGAIIALIQNSSFHHRFFG
tara:strand:+ start:819 stop:1331 length:513 start_codon:yes stop_codon:yes gene_type:complete